MKPKELNSHSLMLGDWVQNTNGNIGRVEGIIPHDDGHGPEIVVRYSPSGTAYSDVKVLRPIPLTVEFLKKTGWEKYDSTWRMPVDKRFYLEYYPHEMRLEMLYEHKPGEKELCFESSDVKYVHELQHAMRLAEFVKRY